MNAVLKTFLSMSASGGLLILALLLGKRLLKDRVSRQWQYYIWLVVILRLLLPFGPEMSLMGRVYRAVDQVAEQSAPLPQQPTLYTPDDPISALAPAAGSQGQEEGDETPPAGEPAAAHPLQDIRELLAGHIWLAWLVPAMGLLLRRITIYQGFMRYIRAGMTPVSDIECLDRLAAIEKQAGIKGPVELCVDPLISSPLLIGFFRPCIVLPGTDIPEGDFQYIALHELIHYKRRDMLYKWLVQATVCLHWFNPLVHLMSREITWACEFSCDEAVLAKMGGGSALDYGRTLLDAMAAVGKYRENIGSVTLSENTLLLKERLGAIMRFKKQSKAAKVLTAVLTLCIVLGASFIGVYSAANAVETPKGGDPQEMDTLTLKGTTYYLVRSEAQLRAIGTGQYGMDQHYMQQADIALSSDEWVPIGTWDDPFTGTYNGNGFAIIGLTMADPDARIIGLFGIAGENAHIYNITLRDYDIARAGKNAVGKSVGAILAVGPGARTYDNFVYPKETGTGGDFSQIEKYYEAGSLPLFQVAFSRLDREAQDEWLDRIYEDGSIMFWGAAAGLLDEDCDLLQRYAEKAYGDGNMAYFSALAMHMSTDALEKWLDKAIEDGEWAFQSILFNALDQGDEFDELKDAQEKEWERARMAEYQAAGVTMEGMDYYYQGQLVNIFLDINQPDRSVCTLNMNPKGTVNIRVVRNEKNEITGVAYMTDAEAARLLEEPFGDIGEGPENTAFDWGDVDWDFDWSFDWDAGLWDWDDSFETQLEETQKAEYTAVGVAVDGKKYYYQGQLAHIFLDTRSNGCYILNVNPQGTVDIKIIRNEKGTATGVAYMTKEEAAELLGHAHEETIPVSFETIAAGKAVLLGEYTLSEGDGIRYDILAETGSRMKAFFTLGGQREPAYWSVNNLRQPGEELRCAADFVVGPLAEPGTYHLYLEAPDGALGNITGSVSIICAGAA